MRRMPYRRKIKGEKMLKECGWRHDGLWYYNPRSGIRYNLQGAMDVEDLRHTKIKI